MARNPNSSPTECSECGASTRLNMVTGKIYSHPVPGSTQTCSTSAKLVAPPQGGEKATIEPLRYMPAASEYQLAESDRPVSIKTVGGGLPGLGRRR